MNTLNIIIVTTSVFTVLFIIFGVVSEYKLRIKHRREMVDALNKIKSLIDARAKGNLLSGVCDFEVSQLILNNNHYQNAVIDAFFEGYILGHKHVEAFVKQKCEEI